MTQQELNKYINDYAKRKANVDAAYLVFRQQPNARNSNRHMTAVHDLDVFCNEVMEKLATEVIGDTGEDRRHVMANFDKYRRCTACGKELLYKVNDYRYVSTSDFMDKFQGVCYDCLAHHCINTSCSMECDLVQDHSTCTFKSVKAILQESDI